MGKAEIVRAGFSIIGPDGNLCVDCRFANRQTLSNPGPSPNSRVGLFCAHPTRRGNRYNWVSNGWCDAESCLDFNADGKCELFERKEIG